MARPSPAPHSLSRSSLVSSATYHSFDVYEPTYPENKAYEQPPMPSTSYSKDEPSSTEMRRQDSGYESISPRTAAGQSSSSSSSRRRRTSNASSSASRPRTRPSVRRATKSGPVAHMPPRTSGHSLHLTRSNQTHQAHQHPPPPPPPPPVSFFHFPSPDPPSAAAAAGPDDTDSAYAAYPYGDDPRQDDDDHHHHHPAASASAGAAESPMYPIPPQTTHYWTSDRTRRLEYAAIDAASRGFKGWLMRNMVPECFVPKERRRIGFDDDSGSVRRYRLELESEESAEKDDDDDDDDDDDGFDPAARKRRSWLWGGGGGGGNWQRQ